MRVRRLAPILLVAAFAACSSPEIATEERTDTLPTQLPAAELPTYAKGDRYIYDNPREVWTIVGLRDGALAFDLPTAQVTPQILD